MGKNIIVRFEEGGIVRCFPVSVNPGTTAAQILSQRGLKGYLIQNAVTGFIYPLRGDLFPLIKDGDVAETIHETMVEL